MTGGWNKTATLQAQFPTLIFNSNASKWGAIGYDYSNAMSFWVNGTSDNVNGTGLNAFQIYNSGSADFNYSLTVANALNVGKVGDVIYTKSNGTSYSRFLYSGANVNVVFTGGTDANNGAFGINNYEDSVRLFNMTNAGTATFTGNVLVNGATAFTGLAGGVAVNGSTSSGIVFRLANANRGYAYIANTGHMYFESTSGNVILSPNGSPALTLTTTGAATFSSSVVQKDYHQIYAGAGNITYANSWSGTDTGFAQWYNAGAIKVKLNSNGDSYFNGGNVGIGTTSPVVALDFGNVTDKAFHLYSSAGDFYGINMKEYDSGPFSTNIFAGNGGEIKFRTASSSITQSTRMTIFSGGNVGINTTTNAGYKFDVSGSGRFISPALSSFGFDVANTSGTRGAGFYTTGGNNVQLYFYNSAGAEKIVLDGGTGNAEFVGNITVGRSSSYGYIYGPSSQIFGSIGGNTTWINSGTSGLRFNNAADNQTRMFMSDAGNFGIGTTSPAAKLDVQGSGVYMNISDTSDSRYVNLGNWVSGRSTLEVGNGDFFIKTQQSKDLFFGTAASERMRILASGPVNLGVPSDYLQFFNDGGGLYAEGTASTDAKRRVRIQMGNSSYNQYSSIVIDGANQTVALNTANATRLFINSGGFVGIATTSPLAPIHALGGTAMTGGWNRTATLAATYPVLTFNSNGTKWAGLGYDYSGSGAFILWVNATNENVSGTGVQAFNIANNRDAAFYGSITATSFFESSDKTIKTLIKDDYLVRNIDTVTAKLYVKNGKQEVGYFAQDVQELLPSAVTSNDDGLLSLSYREVLVAKVQLLEQKIKELESKLN